MMPTDNLVVLDPKPPLAEYEDWWSCPSSDTIVPPQPTIFCGKRNTGREGIFVAGGSLLYPPFNKDAVSNIGNGVAVQGFGEELHQAAPEISFNKPQLLEQNGTDQAPTNPGDQGSLPLPKSSLGLPRPRGTEDANGSKKPKPLNSPSTRTTGAKKKRGKRSSVSSKARGSKRKVAQTNSPTPGLPTKSVDTEMRPAKGSRSKKKKRLEKSTGVSRLRKPKKPTSKQNVAGESQKCINDRSDLEASQNAQPFTNEAKQIHSINHWVGLNSRESDVFLVKRPQKLASSYAPLVHFPPSIPVKLRILRRKPATRPKPKDAPPIDDGHVLFRVYQAVQKKEENVPPVITYTWKGLSRDGKGQKKQILESNRTQSERPLLANPGFDEPRGHQLELNSSHDQHKYAEQVEHTCMQTPNHTEVLDCINQNQPLQQQSVLDQQSSANFQDGGFLGTSQVFKSDMKDANEEEQRNEPCQQPSQQPLFPRGLNVFQGLWQGVKDESANQQKIAEASGCVLPRFDTWAHISHGLLSKCEDSDPEEVDASEVNGGVTCDGTWPNCENEAQVSGVEDAEETYETGCVSLGEGDSKGLIGGNSQTQTSSGVGKVQNVVDRLSRAFTSLIQLRLLPLGQASSNGVPLEAEEPTARSTTTRNDYQKQQVQIMPPQKVTLGRTTGHVPVRVRVIRRRSISKPLSNSELEKRGSDELATLEPAEVVVGTPTSDDPVLRFQVLQVQKRKDAEGRKIVTFQPPMHPRRPNLVSEMKERATTFSGLLRVSSLGSSQTCNTKLFSWPSLEISSRSSIAGDLPKAHVLPSQKAQVVAARAATRVTTRRKRFISAADIRKTSNDVNVSLVRSPLAPSPEGVHQFVCAAEAGAHDGNDAGLENDYISKEECADLCPRDCPSGDYTETIFEERHPIETLEVPEDLNSGQFPTSMPCFQTSVDQSDGDNTSVLASCYGLEDTYKLYLKCKLSMSSCHEDQITWTPCLKRQDESASQSVPSENSEPPCTRRGSSAEQHERDVALSSAEEAYRLAEEAAACQEEYAEQAIRKAAALEAERLATQNTAIKLGALRTAAAAALEEANAAAAATEKAVIGAKEHWKLMQSAGNHKCYAGNSDEPLKSWDLSRLSDRSSKRSDSLHGSQSILGEVSEPAACMEGCYPISLLLSHNSKYQDVPKEGKAFFPQLSNSENNEDRQRRAGSEGVECCTGYGLKTDGEYTDAAVTFSKKQFVTSETIAPPEQADLKGAIFGTPKRSTLPHGAFSRSHQHGLVSNHQGDIPLHVDELHSVKNHFHTTSEEYYAQLKPLLHSSYHITPQEVQRNHQPGFTSEQAETVTVFMPVTRSTVPISESQTAGHQYFKSLNVEQLHTGAQRNAKESALSLQPPYLLFQNSDQQVTVQTNSSCFVGCPGYNYKESLEDAGNDLNNVVVRCPERDEVPCCSCN